MDQTDGIPVLCPCKEGLSGAIKKTLRSILYPLGFSLTFVPCKKIEDALEAVIDTKGTYFDKIPFPVCMPIVSKGAKRSDAEAHYKADPGVSGVVNYWKPNKREVLLLVEDTVELEDGFLGATGQQIEDDRVISFHNYSLDEALRAIVGLFVEIRKTLRANLYDYQLPEIKNNALNYESIQKRVYVWEDGYGMVEMRFDIGLDSANVIEKNGEYTFEHKVSLCLAPRGESKASFSKSLDDMRVGSISEFLQRPKEAFAVIPFGFPSPKVSWGPLNKETKGTNAKSVAVRIKPAKAVTPDGRGVLSYGIIWSSANLFDVTNDATVFLCAHNYRKATYSVCFMRRTLAHGWSFAVGPKLERYGPYQNDLGYIDTEGVGDERFKYLEFPWSMRKIPAGSVLRARWELEGG
jgi:hypothetical protein